MRHMQQNHSPLLQDWLLSFVVVSVVIGFLGVCAIVGLMKTDATDHDIFYLLVGQMGMKFGTVVDYFVGSSRKTKTQEKPKNT
jgi:hypothetical protein